MPPAHILDRVQQIDSKIALLQEDIRNLYELRNATVFSLPAEILSMIFEYLASLAFSCRQYGSRCYPTVAWIRVTHVCRQWRTIALESPRLWGYIPVHQARWVEEMLRRCKSAPIHLLCGGYYPFILDETISMILRKFKQMESIRINSECLDMGHFMSKIVSPIPKLKSLRLYGARNTWINPNLLCPQLSILELRDLQVDSSSLPSLPKLTSLQLAKICWSPDTSSGMIKIAHLLPWIEQMTYLETLELDLTLAPTLHEKIVHKIVHLPHLTHLFISTRFACSLTIFQYLAAPQIRTTKISIVGFTSGFSSSAPLICAFLRLDGADTVVDRITVGTDHEIYGIPGSLKLWVSPNREAPCLAMDSTNEATLIEFFNALPIRNIRAYSLSRRTFLDHNDLWPAFIQESRILEEISVDCATDVTHIIAKGSFPALKRLTISHASFKPKNVVLAGIKRWLQRRQAQRKPIECISIRDCRRFKIRDTEALENLVDVDWDSKEAD